MSPDRRTSRTRPPERRPASSARRLGHVHRGRAAGVLCALLLLPACGIGTKVTDPCTENRAAYESAQRLRAGIRARGMAPTTSSYRLAEESLRRAREVLVSCEAGRGLG